MTPMTRDRFICTDQSATAPVLRATGELVDPWLAALPFEPTRGYMDKFKVFGLQEEPLRNAAMPVRSRRRRCRCSSS